MSKEVKKQENDRALSAWDSINLYEKYDNKDWKTEPNTKYLDKIDEEEKQIVDFCLNKVVHNPKFKMKFFQGEDQLTPFHKLRQFLLELKTLEESIEEFEWTEKKLNLEKEIAEAKMARTEDPVEKKEQELRIIESEKNIRGFTRRAAQHYIEREHYVRLIKEYLDGPEGKTPDGKSLMTVFNTPLEEVYEKEYWTIRLAKQAAMDMLMHNNIGTGNMSAITVLPQDQQNEIFSIAHRYVLEMREHQEAIKMDQAKQLGIENPNKPQIVVETKDTLIQALRDNQPRKDQNEESLQVALNGKKEKEEDVSNR